MSRLSTTIEILYDKLGGAEKLVADVLLREPKSVIPLSISKLAKKCGTSEATITRLSKKLGYEGYQQLKIAVVQDTDTKPIRTDICRDDSPYNIFTKMTEDISYSLDQTLQNLDEEAFTAVCSAIMNAKEILVFGLGSSASVAQDAAHKMLRLGLNAHAYTDNHMQAIVAAHSDESVVAIGVSHSGSSKDIVRTLRLCRANGAVTVGITDRGQSPIYRACTYVLSTVSNETNYTVLGLNSRIAQLALIDTIYSYLVCRLPAAQDAIHKTEEALQSKKY